MRSKGEKVRYQSQVVMSPAVASVRSVLGRILPLIAVFLIAACAEEKPPGYYEHPDGFSLIIPEGWNHQENVGNASVVLWKGERDSTAPVVSVVTTELPPEGENNNFADLNFREAATVAGYLPMRSEEIVIDGDTLPVLLYAYKDNSRDGRWRQGMLTSIVGGDEDERRGYVFLCSSSPGKIEGDLEGYRKILGSFRRE